MRVKLNKGKTLKLSQPSYGKNKGKGKNRVEDKTAMAF